MNKNKKNGNKIIDFSNYSINLSEERKYVPLNDELKCAPKSISYGIISTSYDSNGGGTMNYITREEFNAKMETINTKLDNVDNKIEASRNDTISTLKSYIFEQSEGLKRWIIGAIVVPFIIAFISKVFL